MSRLGDLARRVLAGVFSRECGLVGPRSPEPERFEPEPLWEPPPMRSGPPRMVTDPVLVGRDADGNRALWSPPPLGRPGPPRAVFVDETKPPLGRWTAGQGKSSAVLQGFAHLERIDDRDRDGAPVFESPAVPDIPVGWSVPRSITFEVRDPVTARSAWHVLWCLRIALAVIALDGPPRCPALAPRMLLRCIHCDCVLNNEADWPASVGFYRCAWCAAARGDVAAAERLWGLPVRIAIVWAERDGRAVPSFPPPGYYRRPVTAPTIECYPRGVR